MPTTLDTRRVILFSFKVRDLEMTIAEMETQMKDDQNNWLRLQSHIVEMSDKFSTQLNDSHLARQRESSTFPFVRRTDNELNNDNI